MEPAHDLQQQLNIVLKGLHSRDRNKRSKAISELRELDRSEVLKRLIELLHDSDGEVRCDAALALLVIDALLSAPLVLPLLKDPLDYVRHYICGLLHDFGDARATEPLIEVIVNESDSNVRHIACYALGRIGDLSALSALQWVQQNDRGTDYEGRPVSEMAAEAIRDILARQ